MLLSIQLGAQASANLRPVLTSVGHQALPLRRHCSSTRRRPVGQHKRSAHIVLASSQDPTPDGWVDANASSLRALPLVAGASGIIGVLLNRLVSGVAPVVDASSSQSRTDVLVILLSAVLLLTGLQWLALRPKVKPSVQLEGEDLDFLQSGLPNDAEQELKWAWQSLKGCSTCQAVVVLYNSSCIMHMGPAKPGHKPQDALLGPICRRAMTSEQGNYLANLALYPGRVEFTSFLPENTQAAIIQPIGNDGVLIAASNTQRGFTRLDQAWASTIADKLETSLAPLVQSKEKTIA